MIQAVRSQSTQLRVITDAITGGGLDLRAGQVVSARDLGEHAEILVAHGALEPVLEWDLPRESFQAQPISLS